VRWIIARYLEEVPHSCLRFEHNRVLFILLTLKEHPQWRYRVDELHPPLIPGEGAVGLTGNLCGWTYGSDNPFEVRGPL